MFEDFDINLNPLHFFSLSFDCRFLKEEIFPSFKSHGIPNTSSLSQEYPFAKAAMGWNEKGIGFQFHVDQAAIKSYYPDVTKGDAIEIFIDTRDLKTAGFNTRFCHHFYFLPQPVEDFSKGEITRFRTEDSHELCDPSKLTLEVKKSSSEYSMKIFIPSECLYGYDPQQFDKVGFTYRVNRTGGRAQHFSVSSDEYQIDQNPSLWSSVKLIK